MSFENPTFNTESRTELKTITPDFLQKQIRLPKEQWAEEFKQLVEKAKEREQKKGETTDKSPEILREQTFKRYMDGLGLNEQMIKGKRVLDLGCGEGEFVQSLIENDITPEAYGIDAETKESSVEDRMRGRLLQGDFEKDLPVQNVDYVVSVGAVSTAIWGEEGTINVKRVVENSLAVLKNEGEIRIYPIQEAAQANPLKGLQASQRRWKELIAEISETQGADCRVEPVNIKVAGKNNDVILESVLIIKKRSKN